MTPKGIAFDPVAGFFELAVYPSDRLYPFFDLWAFGITGGDYELSWLAGCDVFGSSLFEVYRVEPLRGDSVSPIVAQPIDGGPNVGNTSSPLRLNIRVVLSCCVTQPGGSVSRYRVLAWG